MNAVIKILKITLCCLVLLLIAGITTAVPLVSMENASMFPGGNTNMLVNLTGMNNFGAVTIDIDYDRTVAIITNASLGFDGFGGDLTSNINNSIGRARFLVITSAQPGPNAPITLVNLSVKALGLAGHTALFKINVVTLGDTDGNYLYPAVTNGTFSVHQLQLKRNVTLDLKNNTIGENGYATLPIVIYNPEENPVGIGVVGLVLRYNGSIVNVVQNATRSQKGNFDDFFAIDYRNASKGEIVIATFKVNESLMGNATVANITFKAVGAAGSVSPLDAEIIAVGDNYASDMETKIFNGTIFVVSQKMQINGDNSVNIGNTVVKSVFLSEVPNGLAGYNISISLSNPGVAKIISIEAPAWALLHDYHSNSFVPSSNVWIKAVDLYDRIVNGAKNVPIANITIQGQSAGSTEIVVTSNQIDDDEGYPILPYMSAENLIVQNILPVYACGMDIDGDGTTEYPDLNHDSLIDQTDQDYLQFAIDAGTTCSGDCGVDIDQDGTTEYPDLNHDSLIDQTDQDYLQFAIDTGMTC